MERFSIYAKGVLVGHSLLESGDAPMGVAFGAFLPSAAYSAIEGECKQNHTDQSALELSIHSGSGAKIECAGVGILHYSVQGEPPFIEVNVLGVPYPLYAELFPGHVASYEQQFSNR